MYVYQIYNNVTGKYYVGKTVKKNLQAYLNDKIWAARVGRYSNMPIVNAIRKYGWDSFSTQTLAIGTSNQQICELEKVWIILLNARDPLVGYNVAAGGEGVSMPCSEEHKLKIGAANKGRKPKGYVRTEEHRQQLRDRMKGNNIGVKITPELAATWKASETHEPTRCAGIRAYWDKRRKDALDAPR